MLPDSSEDFFYAIREGNFWIIEPKMRLDLSFADSFYNKLISHISHDPAHILLNMKSVPYISSSGIRVLLKLKQYLDMRGYKLGIVNLNEEARKIFYISELQLIIPIFQSEHEAFENL